MPCKVGSNEARMNGNRYEAIIPVTARQFIREQYITLKVFVRTSPMDWCLYKTR
jgi:hypothetical protein